MAFPGEVARVPNLSYRMSELGNARIGSLARFAPERPVKARITIIDDRTSQPMPARIHLLDSQGKPHRPLGFPAWHDHFVCDGRAVLDLADETYTCAVERGPEFSAATNRIEMVEGQSRNLAVRLRRIVNLADGSPRTVARRTQILASKTCRALSVITDSTDL
ncbi:MAG: hypothetical protein L0Y58_15880 [Verrucomicrobia subdivision 3 bacterium]|nr:hypothetical protein [Limisphaerales bacterium]